MRLHYNFRNLFTGGCLICLGLLFFAYLLQFSLHLKPCFLCLLQRYILWGMAFVYFVGALHNGRGISRYIYSSLVILFCLLGLLVSGRQIWIQNLPPEQVPPCTAGFDRLLQFHSFFDAFQESIVSAGECAKDVFHLWGLSLAEWSLLGFIILLGFAIYILSLLKKGRI